MKPNDLELVDRLVAEYVLGTLRGPARRRCERWRASIPLFDQRCCFWEEHLMYLAKDRSPIRPAEYIWAAIERQLLAVSSA